MGHNDKSNRGGPFSPTLVPTPSLIRYMDQASSESIDGDAGGTWNPAKPIIVGGAGLVLFTAGGFTGGLATKTRAAPGALILGDNDYPAYTAGRVKNVLFALRDVSNQITDYPISPMVAPYDDQIPGAAVQGNDGGSIWGLLESKHMPQGATLTQVILHWRVGVRPLTNPVRNGPSLILASMSAASSSSVSDFIVPAAAGSIDLYFNGGLPKTTTLTVVNNATIDQNRDYYWNLVCLPTNICTAIELVFITTEIRPAL